MKEIRLHNGMVTKVDDSDYDFLNKFNWTAHYHRKSRSWYAERNYNHKTILMHRVIMSCEDGKIVDHADRDTLNNLRSNLRIATRSQNCANRRARKDKMTSQFLGVAFEKDRKKWTARIRKDLKGYRLGSFDSEIEAAKAYNQAAIKFHGEFANLNQI